MTQKQGVNGAKIIIFPQVKNARNLQPSQMIFNLVLKTRPTSKICYTHLFQTLLHQINAPRYEKQGQSHG